KMAPCDPGVFCSIHELRLTKRHATSIGLGANRSKLMRAFATHAVRLVLYALLLAQTSQGNEPAKRFGIGVRLKEYPQSTPKEALASVLATIKDNNIAYMLAQLADPEFVDKRLKELHDGKFNELVQETTSTIADNPASVKQLEQFLKAGEWEASDKSAVVKLKDFKDRQVYFRKVGDRWFMKNKQK